MRWWLDKGVDGFRMDVINFISKAARYPEGRSMGDEQYTDGSPFFINGPHVHDYLREMNEKVLRHYNAVTVGECPGNSIQSSFLSPLSIAGAHVHDAELFSSPDRHEVNMIFTFEHMDLDGGKWTPQRLDLRALKHHFTTWQTALHGKGWNSLYWNNHDQPRIVSRWGNDSAPYRVLSAKMLATCLHFLCGTPYVYQGEEIGQCAMITPVTVIVPTCLGMTNVRFPSLDDYRDIETINFHREAKRSGLSPEEVMASIYAKSRDNARTPMQWSGHLANGGFTDGALEVTPWINVNPNYTDINAEAALNDPQSIFYYYQKLIELRRTMPIIVYGRYELLHEENPHVFIYKRCNEQGATLLIACNFSSESTVLVDAPLAEQVKHCGQCLISNYDQTDKADWLIFRPYEAWALQLD